MISAPRVLVLDRPLHHFGGCDHHHSGGTSGQPLASLAPRCRTEQKILDPRHPKDDGLLTGHVG